MAKLTAAENRLIDYPPTPNTWVCPKKRVAEEGGLRACGTYNSGRQPSCVLCRAPKPRKPELLWPKYLAACKKAGIEPKGGNA